MTLVTLPQNPVPAGVAGGTFTSYDGKDIRYALWQPPRRGRKGTVCIFTGRTEHIEKYFETVSDLRQRGFAVAIMDWRGQGGSFRARRNPAKGYVEDFDQFERDLTQFMDEIVLPDCPPPYFALAHSMGGNVLTHVACQRDCWFDRIVMTAPMLRLTEKAPSLALLSFFSGLAVAFGFGGAYVPGFPRELSGTGPFEENVLTSDERRYARNREVLEAAPHLGLGAPTFAWVRAASAAMKEINAFRFATTIHVPILIVASGKDTVVSNEAIDELAMQLRAGDRIVVDGARHEILHEKDIYREQFWAAFDAFVPGSG